MGSGRIFITSHGIAPISPASLSSSIWRNRQLIAQLTRREVESRYKGSVLGVAWSFFTPVFMLAVYTFVFSEIFQSRWGGSGGNGSRTQFALILFVGMITLNLFNEVLNRAPGLVIANVNYVKKVIFPLEILPVVATASALFNALISLAVLLTAFAAFNFYVNWTAIFIFPILLPLVILTLGLAWFLAALGVFLRDVGQTIVIVTMTLMFLSPIFYPLDAVPARFRIYVLANPLTFIIGQARDVLIWGVMPDWVGLGEYTIFACVVACAGYAWFQHMRRGFADVL
ncbi:MAG TPA: ABC transporter permease [Tepidisphaeraceae bacterium]|jgi:lipopolysaccharide transport system permease protein